MRHRVIGGEFELAGIPSKGPAEIGCYRYASGRAALYQILKTVNRVVSRVWFPDWLCESMIDAAKQAGTAYGFYRLGNDLRMDVHRFVEQQEGGIDAVVLVNYFGLVDLEETIAELRARNGAKIIIEDDVQALFSFLDGTHGTADFRFTSLRKSIPAPDGGLVRTEWEMPNAAEPNTFARFKLEGSLLKGKADVQMDDREYLCLFEEGERLIEQNYDSRMSDEAAYVLASEDMQAAKSRRRANAHFLVEQLKALGIKPIIPIREECFPLFVPVCLENRDDVRQELRKNNIFCPVHWPLRADMMELDMGRKMAEKELSLVVDQRYGIDDMISIVNVLRDVACK